MKKELWILLLLLALGALLSYLDNLFALQTMLVETIHALVVTAILFLCLSCQRKYPEIRQFGWSYIVWGVFFLTIGSWVDLLDDPPAIALLKIGHVPFGRSWEQAFLKKILGYTGGISLMAYGFFQWIPWMIQTRLNVEQLNFKLSKANRNLNQIQMSLADHIESERLHISRELHDVVAQQLAALNIQLQLYQKKAQSQDTSFDPSGLQRLGSETSDILKNVRRISQGLRPEALYALGLLPTLEQFIQKQQQQHPKVQLLLSHQGTSGWVQLHALSERHLLHLYRIIQELVQNALKHSGASQIEIHLLEDEGGMQVRVSDNGTGFPWEQIPSDDLLMQQGHLGLIGLKERVSELSGTLELTQAEPQGAMACMTLPLQSPSVVTA